MITRGSKFFYAAAVVGFAAAVVYGFLSGAAAHSGVIGVQQMERDALGRLGADARQLAELVDEVLDDAFIHAAHSSSRGRRAATGPRWCGWEGSWCFLSWVLDCGGENQGESLL